MIVAPSGEVVAELIDRIMIARHGGVEPSVATAWKTETDRRIADIDTLNTELNAGFVGRADSEIHERLPVDRRRQRAAMRCHDSQFTGNPIPERRIALTGTEVKSLRAGRATIAEAHAGEMGGEMWLFNAYIPEYLQGGRFNHAPKRVRKLLLHRRQINKLVGAVEREGMLRVTVRDCGSGIAAERLDLQPYAAEAQMMQDYAGIDVVRAARVPPRPEPFPVTQVGQDHVVPGERPTTRDPGAAAHDLRSLHGPRQPDDLSQPLCDLDHGRRPPVGRDPLGHRARSPQLQRASDRRRQRACDAR